MPSKRINPELFLELAETIPVVDVRSPSEFAAGHIPGAVNIPIFSDKERETVGIKYKKVGRIPAIIEGLKLTGPSMALKLEQALEQANQGKLLIHCWRGGMRSEAMAWLFSLGDIETQILDGGYNQYRHHILENLSAKRRMIVLGGLTGSSKTHILNYIRKLGCQIVDLEGLANHKGSAFGALGQPPQPTTEHFANLLFEEWRHLNSDLPVWVEDESRNIGTVFMPDKFYSNMQDTPTIILTMDLKTRLPRLLEEYSDFPPERLKESVYKISKRLGGDNTQEAIKAIETGNIARAIEITLLYYDKTYLFGLNKKNKERIIFVETDCDNIEINARKILEAARSFTWEKVDYID
jgi:tRNA 2-selenouridine synthase